MQPCTCSLKYNLLVSFIEKDSLSTVCEWI